MTKVAKIEQPQTLLPADPMVSMIERVAMDPTADIDKLERMLAMKERLDEAAQQKAFNQAFAECQAEMPKVIANKDNEQTRSKYANLAAIYDAVKPVASKHGFSFSTFPAPCERPGYQGIRWKLRHCDGYTETDIAEVPVDDRGMKGTVNKTITHAFGSTASYGRRYVFCMIFDVAIGDDNDGNNETVRTTVTADQFIELKDLIEKSNTDVSKFILAYGGNPETTLLDEFPAEFFDKAKSQLEAKIAKGQANA